jgi:hypothetical protein
MKFPLKFEKEHLLIQLPSGHWILDTGSPQSFGETSKIELTGRCFDVASNLMGINSKKISELSGIDVQGLVGTDILNTFDVLFDLSSGEVILSNELSGVNGVSISIEMVMGVPTLPVLIENDEVTMFFDTGATFSYWQDDNLNRYPVFDKREDFFPGMGEFEVITHSVPMTLENRTFELTCGRLPELLGMTLSMVGVGGILGNAFLKNQQLAYLPKINQIVLL